MSDRLERTAAEALAARAGVSPDEPEPRTGRRGPDGAVAHPDRQPPSLRPPRTARPTGRDEVATAEVARAARVAESGMWWFGALVDDRATPTAAEVGRRHRRWWPGRQVVAAHPTGPGGVAADAARGGREGGHRAPVPTAGPSFLEEAERWKRDVIDLKKDMADEQDEWKRAYREQQQKMRQAQRELQQQFRRSRPRRPPGLRGDGGLAWASGRGTPSRARRPHDALRSSMARVIGPTPPRRGVIHPATSATVLGHVRDDLAAGPAGAGPDHRRARLHHVGGDEAGRSGRRHDDVGPAHVVGEVGHAGVHDRDRGVAAGPLEGEQQRERPADGEPAADDHDVAALDRDVVGVQQLEDARRACRAAAPVSPCTSRPRLTGWSPSTSLSGSTRAGPAPRSGPAAAAAGPGTRGRPGRR